MGRFEEILEKFLWNYRLIIFLGIISLLVCSAVIFTLGFIETYFALKLFIVSVYDHLGHLSEDTYNRLIMMVITIVDDFLLGIVLLIFGLGTYDLFISKLDPAEEQDDIRPHWLKFESLEELKEVLAKVIMMIMIITFLKYVVKARFENPLEILYLGGALALVGLAIKFSHGKDINKTKFVKSKD